MKLTDLMNPENIKNFISGNKNYLKSKTTFFKLEKHIQEQATWRASKCGPCLNAGSCEICGCKTPEMFYAINKTDSKGRWDKMLSKKDWDEFKLTSEYTVDNIDLQDVEVEKLIENDSFFNTLLPWEIRELYTKASLTKQNIDETER